MGEKTHMKTAILAASRAKYQQIHNRNAGEMDKETLIQELYNARKLKLESKLVSKPPPKNPQRMDSEANLVL